MHITMRDLDGVGGPPPIAESSLQDGVDHASEGISGNPLITAPAEVVNGPLHEGGEKSTDSINLAVDLKHQDLHRTTVPPAQGDTYNGPNHSEGLLTAADGIGGAFVGGSRDQGESSVHTFVANKDVFNVDMKKTVDNSDLRATSAGNVAPGQSTLAKMPAEGGGEASAEARRNPTNDEATTKADELRGVQLGDQDARTGTGPPLPTTIIFCTESPQCSRGAFVFSDAPTPFDPSVIRSLDLPARTASPSKIGAVGDPDMALNSAESLNHDGTRSFPAYDSMYESDPSLAPNARVDPKPQVANPQGKAQGESALIDPDSSPHPIPTALKTSTVTSNFDLAAGSVISSDIGTAVGASNGIPLTHSTTDHTTDATVSAATKSVGAGDNLPSGMDPGTEENRGVDQGDLLPKMKGVFRLLDLYPERGSGGFVDKIVIAQETLQSFINTIRAGASKSVTNIDFAALDGIKFKPIGIYGSKSEIVRFLRQAGAVDDELANLLRMPNNSFNQSMSGLRSGIYAFIPATAADTTESHILSTCSVTYIIYWPEETTWDDSAADSVRKNRVTFMRYLTQLTDQIRALLSPEHTSSLVWNNVENESDDTFGYDLLLKENNSDTVKDRFFKFEVVKTTEQEEGIQIVEGFTVQHRNIKSPVILPGESNLKTAGCPSVVVRETGQAFVTSKYLEGYVKRHNIDRKFTTVALQSELERFPTIILEDSVDATALDILLNRCALESRVLGLVQQYRLDKKEADDRRVREEKNELAKCLRDIDAKASLLRFQACLYVARHVCDMYPTLDIDSLLRRSGSEVRPPDTTDGVPEADPLEYLNYLRAAYPETRDVCKAILAETDFKSIDDPKYIALKKRFHFVYGTIHDKRGAFAKEQQVELVQTIISDADPLPTAPKAGLLDRLMESATSIASKFGTVLKARDISVYARHVPLPDDDGEAHILASLAQISYEEPIYAESVRKIQSLALVTLAHVVKTTGDTLAGRLESIQKRETKGQVSSLAEAHASTEKRAALAQFRLEVRNALASPPSRAPLKIQFVRKLSRMRREEFELKAFHLEQFEPCFEHRIWTLDLTEEDVQRMMDRSQCVPRPRVAEEPSVTFHSSLDWTIRHLQMLGANTLLLVADTPRGISIWLSSSRSRRGFSLGQPTKHIPSVLGRRYILVVDERKRLLTFILMDTGGCTAQQFLMDESYSNLHGRGTPFNLSPWYQDGPPEIVAGAFFSGTEELCLVESSGRTRICSFVSQSFRPATVQLSHRPLHMQSSPDGSALVVIENADTGGKILRVFHQASFGVNNNGFPVALPTTFDHATAFSVTSWGHRGNTFVTAFTPSTQSICSVSLNISKKETEYQFRPEDESPKASAVIPTTHNSLLDCFSELWSRFPVVAAFKRETVSLRSRLPATVTFVCDTPNRPFDAYFRRIVRDFERLSQKPTEQRLERIVVATAEFDHLSWDLPLCSEYKAGEWLVELLCLIPIHIAITLENRFVPLKDGKINRDLEQQLLGADVSQIIDVISLGWYESIFSSYMASKPVRVISSMGEQSVGKSYSLNHLVDSSFAGSAVRTTEGVWLSVCPTRDSLVVALDFEGVHSIERTAQEDMLLVLFNTALSNLVLFRNNFALSRDVANMFTSFQASTHLFDPEANPKLFKGLLAIVIKDVVDGDKKEIVKEFQSKFTQIVLSEQENNFISKLHDSRLTVIPWSVIQSREFYTLFTELGKLLMRQEVTHGSAGEFLVTLKTLMAKMKAQDWGSIDQTLIKYRAASLMAILPFAFEFGKSDASTVGEDLINLDNQVVVHSTDTNAVFCVQKDPRHIEGALASHLGSWKIDAAREPSDTLRAHLQSIADRRIHHVKEWLDANTSRFPAENADLRELGRAYDDISETLRSNLQLCTVGCSTCRLRCTLSRSHDQLKHDCRTSHQCSEACEFSAEHPGLESCDLPAGHDGRHICRGGDHLCRAPCHLTNKKGCQARCTRPIDHVEIDHICSAIMHQCGEPCDLREMLTSNGQVYSCEAQCALPHEPKHTQHSCENRLSCPISCELCQRHCAMGEHFHGFDPNAMHLCGQEHPCSHLCEAPGICEVNTKPHSVKTIFTGSHSVFQYTKSTQIAKRLRCNVPIKSGERVHVGTHVHSTDPNPFHYCEEACINCDYICTLPLGHPQLEHETGHGSMEHTAWAIEGNWDATVEIQGHTFGVQDGGAPQLCSSVCAAQGRHAHIDYCRNVNGISPCQGPESEHIHVPMLPELGCPKDWVSHRLFWARSGFKDPYSKTDQQNFALCDARCAGPEHDQVSINPTTVPSAAAGPSFCTLPIFHPPQPLNRPSPANSSHVSADGHAFACPDPNTLRQAYHVIFVLDKSGSMGYHDRLPLENQPVTPVISRSNNNRFGAVLSALYAFCVSGVPGTGSGRRDSYSAIVFDRDAHVRFENDFTSNPEELLIQLLQVRAGGLTSFDAALTSAQAVMESNWSTDRSPVVVFLSDGECSLNEDTVYDICYSALSRGKPLSLHAVSFGNEAYSRSLRRMVAVAEEVAQTAPRDSLSSLVPCTFAEALHTTALAETFLKIAESLKKPRASLIRSLHPTRPS